MKKQGILKLKDACSSWLEEKLNNLIDEGNEIVQVIPIGTSNSLGYSNWLIIYNMKPGS